MFRGSGFRGVGFRGFWIDAYSAPKEPLQYPEQSHKHVEAHPDGLRVSGLGFKGLGFRNLWFRVLGSWV